MFKLATRRIEPGGTITLTRRHAFTMITTRRYYTGTHGLELQINGQPTGYAEFHPAVPPNDRGP